MKMSMHNGLGAFSVKIRRLFSQHEYGISRISEGVLELNQELKLLENKLHEIDNEKMEIEKLLSDFQYRHSTELGSLLLEILRLRKILYQSDKAKFEEAQMDERNYREQIKSDKKKQKLQLTYGEKKELKRKFRRATLLCHPDKVNENNKAAAERMFINLKVAYDSNDLKKVSEILNDLEKGNFFKSNSDTVSERELLIAEIEKIGKRINSLEKEILSVKNSHAYKTVIEIEDWDEYFSNMKSRLEAELEEMKKQMEV
mgnify:CR=1 FL=1